MFLVGLIMKDNSVTYDVVVEDASLKLPVGSHDWSPYKCLQLPTAFLGESAHNEDVCLDTQSTDSCYFPGRRGLLGLWINLYEAPFMVADKCEYGHGFALTEYFAINLSWKAEAMLPLLRIMSNIFLCLSITTIKWEKKQQYLSAWFNFKAKT